MNSDDPKYHYNRRGSKGARVGQAVSDILSRPQPTYTVEEILEGMGPKFAQELEKSVNDSIDKFRSPFYIFVLTKKEMWADNIIRNWFVPRQTPPYASEMMRDYPNHTKTLYVINSDKGDLKVAWSIPAKEDCRSILKTPDTFNPELVQWIKDAKAKRLDKASYSELFA